jgi:CRP/FNR family transcriptional regulator
MTVAAHPAACCGGCVHRGTCALRVLSDGAPRTVLSITKDQHVFRQADAFTALYALRCGAVKTYQISRHGHENITGFHLPGDIIGFDGLKKGHHLRCAVSIEDASLCVLPKQHLYAAMQSSTSLCGHVLSLMSGAMDDDQQRAQFMSYTRAEERLAAFLLQQSHHHEQRHLSATRFRLPMSRTDIAGYLGLTLESVSRAFRRLLDQQCIRVDGRELEILDPQVLACTTHGHGFDASHRTLAVQHAGAMQTV